MNDLPNETTVILTSKIVGNKVLSNIADYISIYLSDTYGFCLNEFRLTISAKIEDIDWDTEE